MDNENQTDTDDAATFQGELFTEGTLDTLPWAAIITSRQHADRLEAAGEIEHRGDHYAFTGQPKQEAAVDWLAAISRRMEGLRLDPFDYRVLAHLIWRAGDKGRCWPTYGQIQEATTISRRRVAMALASLRRRGIIDIRTGHEGRANEYLIRADLVQDPCTTCTMEPEKGEIFEFRTEDQCTTCTPTFQHSNTPTNLGASDGELFAQEEVEPSTSENRELFAFHLPANLSANTAVMLALGRFERDRSERRKKLTRAAIKILCAKVAGWDPDDIVAAVNTAIEHGWLSLYPPRPQEATGRAASGTAAMEAPKQNYGAWEAAKPKEPTA